MSFRSRRTIPRWNVISYQIFLKNPFLKEYEQIHIATVSPTRKITTFLKGSLKLLYLLITKKVSLVYIHMSEGGSCYRTMVFINLCKLFSTPVVVHSHGSEIEVWYSNINKFLKTKFNNAMNKANAIVVLTPELGMFLETNR